MNLHVIGIGGTGHRILKAIIHLAAVGAFGIGGTPLNINILTVDSDGGNADFRNLQDVIRKYKAYQEVMTDRPRIITDEAKINWSPLATGTKTLSEYIERGSFINKELEEIIDFLYTEGEQNTPLKNGFYGHPSIGSYIVNGELNSADAWTAFIESMNNDENHCVFIIGSVYGGTGASGIPVITEKLKAAKSDVKVATLLSMPYFMPVGSPGSEDKISPQTAYFIPKTKGALYYYEQQKYIDKVDSLYIVGELDSNHWEKEPYSTGGPEQEHKAHISELFAAFACVDFYEKFSIWAKNKDTEKPIPMEGQNAIYVARRIEENEIYPYTWDLIEMQNKNLARQIQIFLLTSILFTKVYNEELGDEKASNPKIKNFSVKKEDKEKLYEYMKMFCSWINELHTKNQHEGNRIVRSVENDLVRLFKMYENRELIDGNRDGSNPYDLKKFEYIINGDREVTRRGLLGKTRTETEPRIIIPSRKILDIISRDMKENITALPVFIAHVNEICAEILTEK